jgi:hypothetical protein
MTPCDARVCVRGGGGWIRALHPRKRTGGPHPSRPRTCPNRIMARVSHPVDRISQNVSRCILRAPPTRMRPHRRVSVALPTAHAAALTARFPPRPAASGSSRGPASWCAGIAGAAPWRPPCLARPPPSPSCGGRRNGVAAGAIDQGALAQPYLTPPPAALTTHAQDEAQEVLVCGHRLGVRVARCGVKHPPHRRDGSQRSPVRHLPRGRRAWGCAGRAQSPLPPASDRPLTLAGGRCVGVTAATSSSVYTACAIM